MDLPTNLLGVGEKVINRLLATAQNDEANDHFSIDIWEWPQGVALFSLYKYYRQTGDPRFLAFITDWFRRMLNADLPARNVNTTAPLLTLAHLYEMNGNEEYMRICAEWAGWITREMPRTEEGGLQHITAHDENPEQIWDDTLFMTVLFLAKMGQVLKSDEYVQEAIYQYLLHIKYLADPVTGLWYHGWTFRGRNHFAEAFWARGNCWFTAGAVELFELLALPGAVRRHLVNALEAQVRKLEELQDESGMWHTLLDDPGSYLETSATAGFAYGILKAVRLGLLDARYEAVGRKAANAVLANTAADGTVRNVSHGTPMGHDKEHYRRIAIRPTAYGQGMAFLLITELIRD